MRSAESFVFVSKVVSPTALHMIQKFSADGYQDELIVDVQNIFFLPLRHLVPIKIVTVQEGLSLLNHQSRQYHEFTSTTFSRQTAL